MITDFTTAFQIGQTLYIENLGSIPKVLEAMSTLVDPNTISKVSELLQAIVHEDKPEHGDEPNEPWYRLQDLTNIGQLISTLTLKGFFLVEGG